MSNPEGSNLSAANAVQPPLTNEMMEYNTLLGQLAKCVCKLTLPNRFGSGFLCAIKVKNVGTIEGLLTNHHVITTEDLQSKQPVKFTALFRGLRPPNEFEITIHKDTGCWKTGGEDLDYTFLEVGGKLKQDLKRHTCEFLQLTANTTVNIGDKILIFQFPGGQDGRPHYSHGCVKEVLNPRGIITYDARTQEGSSGSPVLAEGTETIIAMHRLGSTTAPVNNVGIAISAIITKINETRLNEAGPTAHGDHTNVLNSYEIWSNSVEILTTKRWIRAILHWQTAEGESDSPVVLIVLGSGVLMALSKEDWKDAEPRQFGQLVHPSGTNAHIYHAVNDSENGDIYFLSKYNSELDICYVKASDLFEESSRRQVLKKESKSKLLISSERMGDRDCEAITFDSPRHLLFVCCPRGPRDITCWFVDSEASGDKTARLLFVVDCMKIAEYYNPWHVAVCCEKLHKDDSTDTTYVLAIALQGLENGRIEFLITDTEQLEDLCQENGCEAMRDHPFYSNSQRIVTSSDVISPDCLYFDDDGNLLLTTEDDNIKVYKLRLNSKDSSIEVAIDVLGHSRRIRGLQNETRISVAKNPAGRLVALVAKHLNGYSLKVIE